MGCKVVLKDFGGLKRIVVDIEGVGIKFFVFWGRGIEGVGGEGGDEIRLGGLYIYDIGVVMKNEVRGNVVGSGVCKVCMWGYLFVVLF